MDLTDLEAAALGRIHAQGGCTAYALRRHFGASPSARFSDSAGSVYPMVQRLARRGLLAPRRTRQGRRAATVYALTSTGRAALRRWLAVPARAAELVPWDPLRTRVLYLGLLPRAGRRRWVDAARSALAAHADGMRALCDAEEDPWRRLAHRNTLLEAEARLRWLDEVRAVVDG